MHDAFDNKPRGGPPRAAGDATNPSKPSDAACPLATAGKPTASSTDRPRDAGNGLAGCDAHGRPLLPRPTVGRQLVGRPPNWRQIRRIDIQPLAGAAPTKPDPIVDPQLSAKPVALPPTASPDATVTASGPTGPEPTKDGAKPGDAPEKRKKRRAKPEIDLAAIDKIVRDGGRFLTEREVAAHLHFAASSLRNGRGADKDKWPKALKFGRSIRFDPADVREFVERGRK